MSDPHIDAGAEPADGARRRRSAGSARGDQRGRAGFGEGGGRSRGARQRESGPADEEMADPVAVARGICLRALTGAARTRQQLAELLARKEVPPEAAEAVLDRLSEVGLVDDAAFAAAWVSSRQTGRGLSRRALATELRAKGVDGEVAAAAVAEVDPQAEWDTARRLVQRKAPSMRRLDRATAERRLVGMLARKGYGGGLAGIVVREALDEVFSGAVDEDSLDDEDLLEDEDTAAGGPDEALGAGAGPTGRAPSGSVGGRTSARGPGSSSGSAGARRNSSFGSGGIGSRGFGSGGAGGFGGRTTGGRASGGKPNGSALGGGGGMSGQRAASMADEVGEGHREPLARRADPTSGQRR